ncbi:MAG: hypothetical protein Q9165_006407 [Trypethelium subeluteriae]
MAFRRPPQPFQQQRQISYANPDQQLQLDPIHSPQRKRVLEESQEWVLFSPTAAPSTTQTPTTSTERTPKTAGRSRLSDFGSLDTAARSDEDGRDGEEEEDDATCQGTEIDEEENEELDSLDDGLHAFHERPERSGLAQRPNQSGSILPTHDGLGGFRASAMPVQEHLWQYERYNPRRKHARRRSSVQKRPDALEMEGMHEDNHENEKNHRIEEWRMEQSRALLEEIERETRRQRRMSKASVQRSSTDAIEEDQASLNCATMEEVLTRSDSTSQSGRETQTETFWQRFTRKMIHDLMGIDENILSVILGEKLSEDSTTEAKLSPLQTHQEDLSQEGAGLPISSWQHRLLQRVARELGILVHHISEHPGAFSTYLRTQETPMFVGSSHTANESVKPYSTISPVELNQPSVSTPLSAPFAPTLQQPTAAVDVSMWGVETDADADATRAPRHSHLPNIAEEPTNSNEAAAAQEREYWEQELDIKMVFNYLRKRFSSRPISPEPDVSKEIRRDSGFVGSADMSVSPESRRRAALIRRHHPLTSRSAAAERTTPSASRRSELLHRHHIHHHTHGHNHTPLAGVAGLKRPGSSSCASQSTKSRKSLGRQSASSSRNYWDLGGSVGSAGFGSDAGIA